MSFTEPEAWISSEAPPAPSRDTLLARQRELRRRRGLRRLDVALGVLIAIAAIIIAPGLAVVAIIALIVLLACGLSFLHQRRRQRRSGTRPGAARRGRRPRERH